MVELAQSHVSAARDVANELREINAENGYSYFILAQYFRYMPRNTARNFMMFQC